MYFSGGDGVSTPEIASLGLNQAQKVYLEHGLPNYIQGLLKKYQIEFTEEGIHILVETPQLEQEIVSDLNELHERLNDVSEHELPSLTTLDQEILQLKDSESGKTILETILEQNKMILHEGNIYGTQVKHDEFTVKMSETITKIKIDECKYISGVKDEVVSHLGDIQEGLNSHNCMVKHYPEDTRLAIYGQHVEPDVISSLYKIIKQINLLNYETSEEEQKVPKPAEPEESKSDQTGTKSSKYVIMKTRPGLYHIYIAPYFYVKVVETVEGELGSFSENEWHEVTKSIHIYKTPKK